MTIFHFFKFSNIIPILIYIFNIDILFIILIRQGSDDCIPIFLKITYKFYHTPVYIKSLFNLYLNLITIYNYHIHSYYVFFHFCIFFQFLYNISYKILIIIIRILSRYSSLNKTLHTKFFKMTYWQSILILSTLIMFFDHFSFFLIS